MGGWAWSALWRDRSPGGRHGLLSSRKNEGRAATVLKTGCAVAAVLAAAALWICAQGVSQATLGRSVNARECVENVHATRICPRTGEVIQEMWMSTEMNILAMTVGREHVVYDLGARRKKCTDLVSGRTEFGVLNDLEYAGVRKMIAACPSPILMDAPTDARWSRIQDEGDWGVFQFTRTEQTSAGQPFLVRYEVAVDRLTKLPQVFRLFHNGPATDEWEYISKTTFDYPTTAQMESLVEHASD